MIIELVFHYKVKPYLNVGMFISSSVVLFIKIAHLLHLADQRT
jgi:hypothetical protein